MLINLIKGDLKLVNHYISKFKTYPKVLRRLGLKLPGLVPPFYADLPESFEELVRSEINYTKSYLKQPILTDLKYFCKAMYNIFVVGARSK